MYKHYFEDTDGLTLHPWGVSKVGDVNVTEDKSSEHAQGDLLWKGIIENLFEDFLCFFFPDANRRFDLDRGFTFLDKQLEQLFPPENNVYAPRHVDKLVKVFSREGREHWLLIHIEVQGYRDPEFARRMYRYHCRIWDKYQRSMIGLAIFTDGNRDFYADHFGEGCPPYTWYSYVFKAYKILDQDERELERSNNPFALVILIAKAAIKAKKLNDGQLYPLKMKLVRLLHQKQIPVKKIRPLMNFLRYHLLFKNPETNTKFEQEIEPITGRKNTMGIEELLLERAKYEGEIQGKEKKESSFVENLLRETDFSNEKIASLAGVSTAFVEKVRTAQTAEK